MLSDQAAKKAGFIQQADRSSIIPSNLSAHSQSFEIRSRVCSFAGGECVGASELADGHMKLGLTENLGFTNEIVTSRSLFADVVQHITKYIQVLKYRIQ